MKKSLITGSFVFQLCFWLSSFFILYRIFTKDYNNGTVDLIYTFLFHLPLFFIVFSNLRLSSYFLAKKKYGLYLFSIPIMIILGIAIHHIVFDVLASLIFSGFYFISMFSYMEIALYLLSYIVVSLLLNLSWNWFELREKQMELESRNQKVQLDKLKSQLNPHFLFNSLNNIYALSGPSDSRSKEYIIKLSDALRYMLYKTNEDTVCLKDEIEYLENYIALEKLRLEENSNLSFDLDIENPDIKIAPLMLLTLVENAFKHSDKQNIDIVIKIIQKNEMLMIECVNGKINNKIGHLEGGIGLQNLKKRLDLIYADRYEWDIIDDGRTYKSLLKIEL